MMPYRFWPAAFALIGVLDANLTAAFASWPVGIMGATVPAQGDYGTIKGRLIWGGDAIPPAGVLVPVGQAAANPEVCARNQPIPDRSLVVDPATRGVRNGYAYLVQPRGANPGAVRALLARAPRVEFDQRNCEFIPHAAALLQEQRLIVKSSEPIPHSVRFWAFNNGAFNQIMPPHGQIEVRLVAERRPISLACDLHPWMTGLIMVFDHPFFSITEGDGSFEIAGVPAGQQHLVLWHEKRGYVTRGGGRGLPVDVRPGQIEDVGDIVIP